MCGQLAASLDSFLKCRRKYAIRWRKGFPCFLAGIAILCHLILFQILKKVLSRLMQMGILMKETIRWLWFCQLWENLLKKKWVFYQTKMPGNIWTELSAKRWRDLRRCSLKCLRWFMEYSKRQLHLILERGPQLRRFLKVNFLLTSGRKMWNTTVSICRWSSRGTSRTWLNKIWGNISGNIC